LKEVKRRRKIKDYLGLGRAGRAAMSLEIVPTGQKQNEEMVKGKTRVCG